MSLLVYSICLNHFLQYKKRNRTNVLNIKIDNRNTYIQSIRRTTLGIRRYTATLTPLTPPISVRRFLIARNFLVRL